MDKMIEISEEIGKLFPYVRVDFYDVDGKIYLIDNSFGFVLVL